MDLQQKLKEREETLKRREDDEFRMKIEQSKLSALLEQKLELTEKELKDYKSKWTSKENDIKELNKELMASKKELLAFSDKLRLAERMHGEEIANLKTEYEAKL